MPSIKAREFQRAFEKTFAKGARLEQKDVDALEKAAKGLRDAREKSAANDVLRLVRHDRILDESEVEPAREALCRLLGVSSKKLPPALEQVLARAVPVPNVRVTSYDLSFDFSKDVAAFPAQAKITLEAASPKTCILEIDPDRISVSEVRAGGRVVPFTARDGRLFVDVGASGVKDLDIRYTVKPTDDVGGYGLIRDRYANRMWTLTWPYNTGALFPSSSRPDDGATARVTVHTKAGHDAVGPGGKQRDGAFHLDKPVPAYAIAFTTGILEDMQTSSVDGWEARTVGLGKKIDAGTRKEMRETVAQAMAWFSKKYGEYPNGKVMNIVEIKSEYGGMEHAGAIAIAVGQTKADTLEACVHETAHSWFGDGIRISHWGELWMSEGFTNYTTWRFFQHKDGDDAFYKYLDSAKSQLKEQLDEGVTQPLDEKASVDPKEGLSWVPYMQGSWMLRMLECRVGTEKLDRVLRDWFKAEKGTAVSTDDFIAFAKKREGLDLAPFFKAWAQLERIPSFTDKSKIDGTKVTLSLAAHKKNEGDIEKIPVLLEGKNGQSKEVLVEVGKPMTVDAGFAITSLTWDPHRTLLCDVE